VEITQPGTTTSSASTPSRRRRWPFIVLAVAVVLVVASVSVYVLTRPPPIPLTVSDGSIGKILEATFADYSNTGHPIFRIYTATTYANESGGATSTLTLRLFLGAFYDPHQGAMLDLFPVVSGKFAPDLSPTGLTLTFNQTGRQAFAFGYPYATAFNNSLAGALIAFPGPTNVTSTSKFLSQVVGNGSASMSATFQNTSKTGPYFEFLYPSYIDEQDPLGDNAFLGIRATVTGPFTPAVSVGILVHLVNIPVTFSDLFATIERSADGTRWNLNVTSAGYGYSNTTTYLRVLTLDGAAVVPATALGALYRSPYNGSIAYTPATPGSSVLSRGDLLTLSAALYSENDLVQILTKPVTGDVILYEATLG